MLFSSRQGAQKMKITGLARTTLAVLALLSLNKPFASEAPALPCIGVIPAGSGHVFWREVERGARRAGQTLGVEIYFRGPSEDNALQAQRSVIDIIARKACVALVLAPAGPALSEDVTKLRERGIPTIHIDRSYDGEVVAGVVATDNYQAGVLAGKLMVSLLPPGAAVGLLRLQKGISSTDAREAGFVAAVSQGGLRVVLETELGPKVGEARVRTANALSVAPADLAGVFAPNESSTAAAVAAMRKTGLAGRVKLIGFDINRTLLDGVRAGDVHALIVQRPEQMGYEGVMRAWAATRALGKATDAVPRVDTGTFVVDAARIDSAAMRDALAPYLNSPR
jgi:ribose transport system substrate-binding protein